MVLTPPPQESLHGAAEIWGMRILHALWLIQENESTWHINTVLHLQPPHLATTGPLMKTWKHPTMCIHVPQCRWVSSSQTLLHSSNQVPGHLQLDTFFLGYSLQAAQRSDLGLLQQPVRHFSDRNGPIVCLSFVTVNYINFDWFGSSCHWERPKRNGTTYNREAVNLKMDPGYNSPCIFQNQAGKRWSNAWKTLTKHPP